MFNFKMILVVVVGMVAIATSTSTLSTIRDRAEYIYFTQERNVTEINTHIPVRKGLLGKTVKGKFKSTGNYVAIEEIPQNHIEIGIRVDIYSTTLKLYYAVKLPKLNSRIPASRQIFRESTAETYVYIVLPKNVFPVIERQSIYVSDYEQKRRFLAVLSPDKTNLSRILEKYNSILVGNGENYSSEMERALDGTLDLLGKPGKVMGWIMSLSTWVIKEGEEKRVRELREKYGEEYEVYKIPFHVLDGIDPRNINIGRMSAISFHSENPVETKIFIEIPRVTFELDVSGASRRASLEGLVYEMSVVPEFIKVAVGLKAINPAVKDKGKQLSKIVYKTPPPRPSVSIYDAVEWGNGEQVYSHYYYKTANMKGDRKNVPLLFVAISKGHLHIVEQLLSYGVSPDTICDRQRTTIGKMMQYDIPYGRNTGKMSALGFAIYKRNVEMVKLLLDMGVNPESGMSFAMGKGRENYANVEMVKLLLSRGASLKSLGTIVGVIREGNFGLVKLLIDIGVDIGNEEKALGAAFSSKNQKVIDLLIDTGIDAKGNFRFKHAIESNNIEVIKDLIRKGLDSSKDNFLWRAVQNNNVVIVKLLLDSGADIDSGPNKHFTPLARAISGKNIIMVKLLLDSGAKITRDNLAIAIDGGELEITKLFLKRGMTVDDEMLSQVKRWNRNPKRGNAWRKRVKLVIQFLEEVVGGMTRKDSLEGLVYETVVRPEVVEPANFNIKSQINPEFVNKSFNRNVALQSNGGVATSGSVGTYGRISHPASYANDGDETSSWNNSWKIPDWMMIELNKSYLINKVGVIWGGHNQEYSISLSEDGLNWKTVVSLRSSKTDAGYNSGKYRGNSTVFRERFEIVPMLACFIRINVVGTSAPGSHIFKTAVRELQAFVE